MSLRENEHLVLPRVGTLKLLALSLYLRTVQTIVNIGEIFLLEVHLATTLQDEHSVCTFSLSLLLVSIKLVLYLILF